MTIVSAMALSVLVALVLTPALCATILRRPKDHATQTGPFGWFNRVFDRGTTAYRDGSHGIINRSWRFLAVFLAIVIAMGWMFARLPSSFLPDEDQGILITSVSLPVGATQDRTERVLKQVTDHYLNDEKDAVAGVFTASGFGFGGAGQNVGIAFVPLKEFSQRKSPALAAQAVAGRAMGAFRKIRDAQVFALAPPAIQGFGNTNGFDFYLQDVNGAGHDALIQTRNQLLGLAGQSKLLTATRPNGQEDQPQFSIDIDQEKASALGVSLADINNTLSSAWGSDYVNDFIDRGRVKPVYMQSDANFRMQPEDLDKWQVRNASGAMVPFSALLPVTGPSVRPGLNATMARPRSKSRAPLHRAWFGRRHGRDRQLVAQLPRLFTNGPGCRIRSGFPTRRCRSMRSRRWSCSCASQTL